MAENFTPSSHTFTRCTFKKDLLKWITPAAQLSIVLFLEKNKIKQNNKLGFVCETIKS